MPAVSVEPGLFAGYAQPCLIRTNALQLSDVTSLNPVIQAPGHLHFSALPVITVKPFSILKTCMPFQPEPGGLFAAVFTAQYGHARRRPGRHARTI
jgi:hypothetical protein